MKLRSRLTLLFSLITAGILLGFALVVYYGAERSREREFYRLLRSEAVTKANLYFDAKVPEELLQNIYRSNRELIYEVEAAIYAPPFELLYHDAVEIDYVKESPELIAEILRKGEVAFYEGDWQVVGLRIARGGREYVITAAAFDDYGYTKLTNLRDNMAVSGVIALIVLALAGYFFSKRALEPVRRMNEKALRISATNLDLRLDAGPYRDELAELADTFNGMLNKLEQSFDAQKQFVHNTAHELRTPLAAVVAELELALNAEREPAELRAAIRRALGDARRLSRISGGLLDLAKAGYDPSQISFETVRADELLIEAAGGLKQANPRYKIDLEFSDVHDPEAPLLIEANTYLLRVAFANVMDNACKFSPDKRCRVIIEGTKQGVKIAFEDKGPGIPEEDLPRLFEAFYRGENRDKARGSGIGLSLTRRITELHGGQISVASTDKGTTLSVTFGTKE